MEGYLFNLFSRQVLFFFWVPGSMLSCFPAVLLLCFSASLLLCFSAFPLLCLSPSLLFCFLLFLLLSLLLMLLCFTCFFSFLLLCFPCFSASLLFCFCASVPFYFYYYTFSFLQSCVVAALLPAPLLLCFLSLLPLCFCSFLLPYSLLFSLKTLGETQRSPKEILIRTPDKKPLHETLNEP